MKIKKYNAVVIGGGAAGMAAALSLSRNNIKTAIIEREKFLGGILHQCIHNGFGLHTFKEELTGPEFAERFEEQIHKSKNIDIYLQTTAMQILKNSAGKTIYAYSGIYGIIQFKAKALILAMGCRERNRGNIGTPGTRPSGLFTAGLAQRLLNIDGYIPGKRIVIVGSGDIGLIMARRLTWVGSRVLAVVEINPFASGIIRNIVQCLHDYNIPLYLNHIISKISGNDRVEKVEVTPLVKGKPDFKNSFKLKCDTLLFSVGLIPDTQLIENTPIQINYDTNGPYVDACLMTESDGLFACGNVLHVHDIVDFVAQEAEQCGEFATAYIKGKLPIRQFKTIPGSNVKYIIPNKYAVNRDNKFYLRSLIVKKNAKLSVHINNNIIFEKKLSHIQPSEMIILVLNKDYFKNLPVKKENSLKITLQ